MYGLTPHEIFDLSLEEYNAYIIGVRMREQRDCERDLTLAYLIAQFNNSKKVKPLDHYIRELRRANGHITMDRTPVDAKRSRKLAHVIKNLNVEL